MDGTQTFIPIYSIWFDHSKQTTKFSYIKMNGNNLRFKLSRVDSSHFTTFPDPSSTTNEFQGYAITHLSNAYSQKGATKTFVDATENEYQEWICNDV